MPFWPNVTPAYCGWGPTPPLALNPGGTSAHFGSRYSLCPILPKPTPVGWEGMIVLPHTVAGRTSTSPVVHARLLGPHPFPSKTEPRIIVFGLCRSGFHDIPCINN